MSLWLPVSEQERQAEILREHRAEIARHYETLGQMRHWNKMLKEVSPDLELFKVREDADGYGGLKPGYWVVIKNNHGAPPDVIHHEGPDGEYRDLDSSLLDRLRKGHLWSNRSMKQMKDADRKLQLAAERQREREKEERIDEVMERLGSLNRTQILVKDKSWT